MIISRLKKMGQFI